MQRVFITGVSSGIGKALAQAYAAQGASLGLVARRSSRLQELLASLPHPERHRIYALDVRDHTQLAQAAADFLAFAGGIDIVIANAGVSQGTLTAEVEDLPVFTEVMDINFNACVATFSPFIAAMRAQAAAGAQGLRLVGISSVAGIRGLPGAGAYCASKAALSSYCESLRIELAASGIRVVTIAPGFVATEMTAHNKFRMPFLISAEEFARRALRVIGRGAGYRIIPWQMCIMAGVLRCLPNIIYDAIMARAPTKPRAAQKT